MVCSGGGCLELAHPHLAHTPEVRSRVFLILVGSALAASACSAHTTNSPHPTKTPAVPSSRLVVHAHASVIHSGRTYTLSFGGKTATATSSDGSKSTATFDAQGVAKLSLTPGRYQVTTSIAGACSPAGVSEPRLATKLELSCALP